MALKLATESLCCQGSMIWCHYTVMKGVLFALMITGTGTGALHFSTFAFHHLVWWADSLLFG